MTAKILIFRDYQPRLRERPPPGTTAVIFDLASYQSKKALKPETLEQQAVLIINVALADHLDDTAPCELNPQEPA